MGGLNRAEAAQYASHLLAPYPAAQARRERQSFGELLDWLDGHPLAMRLTLPRLDTTDPGDLLAGLRGTTPLPAADDPDAGRTTSLPASITYSYAHLAGQTQRLLPAVSLFHGVADEDVLAAFSAAEGVPGRFAGVSRQEWTAVLEDAARVGLLTGLGAACTGSTRLCPATSPPDGTPKTPSATARSGRRAAGPVQRLRRLQPVADRADRIRERRPRLHPHRAAAADPGRNARPRPRPPRLGQSQGIVRALDAYWDTRGLSQEAAAWADRILAAATDPGQDRPAAQTPAGSLWLYTTIRQATRQKDAGQPDQAAQTYRHALAYLQDQPETEWTRSSISVTYHQLGMTAQDRGRLDEADDWYRKSLTIKEELGNRPGMAITYHQLGMTAQDRGRLDEADDWYRKSLTIFEELGDRPGMAITYHQLGNTAYLRGRLDEADDWYRKSLTIKEELGNRQGMAGTYHQLGMTAQNRGRLDDADDWYRKALTIKEELGNRPGMALTYAQLGLLAEERSQPPLALEWNIRCVTLFDQFPHPMTGTGPAALARLTRQLGMPALEQAWQQITGQPVPQAVRDHISHHGEKPGGQP